MSALTPTHLMPSACYVCGRPPHSEPLDEHTYWSNTDAATYFATQPAGAYPSMTAVETLDPRAAVAA